MFFSIEGICNDYSILAIILFVKKILNIIFIIVPIGLVLMLSIDLAKNVIASDNDIGKNINVFIKRIIFCVLLFFVFPIVSITINLVTDSIDEENNFLDCYTNATDNNVSLSRNIYEENNRLSYEEYLKEVEKYRNNVQKNSYNRALASNNTGIINGNKYDGIIYVGDSRTIGMCKSMGISSSKKFKDGESELCITNSSGDVKWFKNTAQKHVLNIVNKNPSKNYIVVVSLGINSLNKDKDGTKDAKKYVKEYNSFSKKISNSRLVITSVTQVDDDKKTNLYDSAITSFNSYIKKNVDSSTEYCDTYSYLKNEGYEFIDNGINYNSDTYKKLYSKISDSVSKVKVVPNISSSSHNDGAKRIINEALKFVKKMKSDGDWTYGKGGFKKHRITCGAFVTYVLKKAGYSKGHVGHADYGLMPKDYKNLTKDMEIITKKELGRDIRMSDLKPGDVVVKNGLRVHDIAIFVYKDGNKYYYYGANSNNTVVGYRKSTKPKERNWFTKHGITSIIRVK